MLLRLLLLLALLLPLPARADTEGEVRAAYTAFAEAQNARDPARIRAALTAAPDLLWVSDGQSFWGADAIVARMTSFQGAEVWRVEPGLDAARVVAYGDDLALLHMPLTLVIGAEAAPDRLGFLVSLLFRREAGEWRIAALLTTRSKP